MKLKARPEDFVVRESYRFDDDPAGAWRVYLMDKQKLTTLEAVARIAQRFRVPTSAVSFCGLKDKQGRTEQIVAVRDKDVQMQDPDLRLKPLGRTREALSARNLTGNRFSVIVRDLSPEDVARVSSSVAEVRRVGLVNYFDSQRFGGVKHGQGFIAKDLVRGQLEHALHNYMAKPSALDETDDAKVKAFWAENWGHWERHCPFAAVARYRELLQHLRQFPADWVGAFRKIEPRYRAMIVFEYQSYLWNEGVKELLRALVGEEQLVSLPYQAGRLLFYRDAPGGVTADLSRRTFPLLAHDSAFPDGTTRKAVERVLQRERVAIPELDLKRRGFPDVFFKHGERPVVVFPEKLVIGEARRDELTKGRLKVPLAFTLPPGAYATLLVKRLFWFAVLEDEAAAQGDTHPRAAQALGQAFGPPPAPVEEPRLGHEPPRKIGFREAQKRRKEARAEARAIAAARTSRAPAAKRPGTRRPGDGRPGPKRTGPKRTGAKRPDTRHPGAKRPGKKP